jgi:hypothetical protein
VASKRIRHNQIKTDKVGVLKNHAPIVGCRNEQQFDNFKTRGAYVYFFGNVFNEFFKIVWDHFEGILLLLVKKAYFFELMFFTVYSL